MPDYPDGDASSFAGRTAGGTGGGEGGGKQEIDVFLARSGGNDFRRAGRPSGAIDNDRKIARGARGRENERRLSTDSPWSSHGCQESRGESDKSVTPLGRQTGGAAASKRLSRSPMTTSVPPPAPRPGGSPSQARGVFRYERRMIFQSATRLNNGHRRSRAE